MSVKAAMALLALSAEEWEAKCNSAEAYSDLAPAMLSASVVREDRLRRRIAELEAAPLPAAPAPTDEQGLTSNSLDVQDGGNLTIKTGKAAPAPTEQLVGTGNEHGNYRDWGQAVELPPLPKPLDRGIYKHKQGTKSPVDLYDPAEMQAYARAALAARQDIDTVVSGLNNLLWDAQERIGELEAEIAARQAPDSRDAARYRWLRDKSDPGICAFYLSVGKAFDGVQFNQDTVDCAIDAQIVAQSEVQD